MKSRRDKLNVLLGCPVHERKRYVMDEYLKRVSELTYKGFDVLLVDNSSTREMFNDLKERGFNVIHLAFKNESGEKITSRERINVSYNVIRDHFLKHKEYSYLFCLEFDVIPPKDVIQRLLAHRKDVVSGVFHIGLGKNRVPCVMVGKDQKVDPEVKKVLHYSDKIFFYDILKDLPKDKLIPVFACGLGCVLVSRKVMDMISFRYSEHRKVHNDMYFYFDLRANKITPYVDTSILCEHKNQSWEDFREDL